jgi:hypothetical protein
MLDIFATPVGLHDDGTDWSHDTAKKVKWRDFGLFWL